MSDRVLSLAVWGRVLILSDLEDGDEVMSGRLLLLYVRTDAVEALRPSPPFVGRNGSVD